MRAKHKSIERYWWHLIFWSAYFTYGWITDVILDPNFSLVVEIILFATHNIFLFYGLLFFCRKFSLKTKKSASRTILLFLVIVSTFIGVRLFVNFKVYPVIYIWQGLPLEHLTVKSLVTGGTLWITHYFFISSAYFYFTRSIEKERKLRLVEREIQKHTIENILLQQKQLEGEQQKLQLENTILRAQINPHFLYNTLNFLYAKSLPLSSDLSNGIMKLSDIMRHSLQPQDEQGFVYLNNEVEHVRNIIEINELRFNNKLCIQSSFSDIPADLKIIPLVLITLVENVLKHGDLTDENNPAKIDLQINGNGQLHFSTWNIKRNGPKEHSTGIGLENTIKRLRLAYGDSCSVKVENGANFYRTAIYIHF